MSFSHFKTIDQVQKLYDIALQQQSIITPESISPSTAFVENLEFDMQNVDVRDEAARREAIIYPLLREIFRHHADKLSLFSHRPLVVEDDSTNSAQKEKIKRSGVPDYLVSTRSPLGRTVMGKPLLIVVEAKRDDFDLGWAQCLAEMIAAQRYNETDEIPVHGIVTNGPAWEFGQLTQKLFLREPGVFPLRDLDGLLGAVKFVFSKAELEAG
ncbi:MAG: hypothetical protein AAF639_27400 [Chloroflexota bacterium]